MKTITCKELANGLGCNYVVAAGLMQILVKTGQAKVTAKVFHESGKGKPTNVYSLKNNVNITIPSSKPSQMKLVGYKLVRKSLKKAV